MKCMWCMSNYAQQVIAEELPGGLRLARRGEDAHAQEHERAVCQRLQSAGRHGRHPLHDGDAGAHRAWLQRGRPAARRRCRVEGKEETHPRSARNAVQPRPCQKHGTLLLAGATILPANPGFYAGPKTIQEVVDTVVARVLDHLGSAAKTRAALGGGKGMKVQRHGAEILGRKVRCVISPRPGAFASPR